MFIIGVSLFVSSFLEPRTSTTTTTVNITTPPTTISAVATGSINPSNNLQLQLSLNISLSATNVTLDATLYDYNTLNSTNNVTSTLSSPNNTTSAGDWAVAISGDDGAPCQDDNWPIGVAIAQGHYTLSNMSTAKLLDLVDPNASYACPAYGAFYYAAGYLFQPTSEIAKSYGCLGVTPCLTEDVSAGVDVKGYWNQGSTFTSFQPGTYTVLGEDEWGGTILAYFTVS